MNRIARAFEGKKAFIPFITAGDPSPEITEKLIYALEKAGADLIEIGVPFSDPVAEGPVIEAANARALSAGFTTDTLFELMLRIRKNTQIPIVFLTYLNPVFTYGAESFMRQTAECGVDALIVPDMPPEENDELAPLCAKYGVITIPLVAPTSGKRIKSIAAGAQGFVYCVSSMGVTGMREKLTADIRETVSAVKSVKEIPCAVGFGITTPEQAREMAAVADGVIVGSAIVNIIAQHGENCVKPVAEYAEAMKRAING
ncbi:MAG: tryptophan synthase subunit alpha [Oscillospiraceae bacterium]|jgi:tryptophan synthase alpha chain|nr:tryptophan synthase subunit alpha [Oscillospiraceae bacterium]